MGVMNRLLEEFDKGRRPVELVREGYPKSTVYTAYRRWLERRGLSGSYDLIKGIRKHVSSLLRELRILEAELTVLERMLERKGRKMVEGGGGV